MHTLPYLDISRHFLAPLTFRLDDILCHVLELNPTGQPRPTSAKCKPLDLDGRLLLLGKEICLPYRMVVYQRAEGSNGFFSIHVSVFWIHLSSSLVPSSSLALIVEDVAPAILWPGLLALLEGCYIGTVPHPRQGWNASKTRDTSSQTQSNRL
ncbi:hypothetical protein GQ53DRAFT_744622, partial [Thozetella sp. PMI_491]